MESASIQGSALDPEQPEQGSCVRCAPRRAPWVSSLNGVLAVTGAAAAQLAPATEEAGSALGAPAPSARIHVWLPDARHEAMASVLRLGLAARGVMVETLLYTRRVGRSE